MDEGQLANIMGEVSLALADDPERAGPHAIAALSIVLLYTGNPEKAKEWLHGVIDQFPEDLIGAGDEGLKSVKDHMRGEQDE